MFCELYLFECNRYSEDIQIKQIRDNKVHFFLCCIYINISYNMKENIHIGKIIKEELRKQGKTNGWLAS